MAEYVVIHKEHDGTVRDEFHPHNLEFSLNLNEPHEVTYDVPLAYPNMHWGFVGPYRTLFELWNTAYSEPLMAGMHVSDSTTQGEDVIHVSGKDWLHYLQRRHYPYGGVTPEGIGHANDFLGGTAANEQGIAYQGNLDIATHVANLITITCSRPRSLDITPAVGLTGQVQPYNIELGDTEWIYDKIVTLSENAQPGFDFWVDYGRTFRLAFPHIYDDRARTDPNYCIHVFDKWIPPTDLIEATFQNDGPEMTHILGVGAGSTGQWAIPFSYKNSEDIFFRLDGVFDAGEVKNLKHLANLTHGAFSKGLYPVHTVPITVRPDVIPDFWGKFRPGEAVWIREDFESRNINTAWQMQRITCRVSREGEESVEINGVEVNERGLPGLYHG